ncbi:MAG: hypothetical protein U0793_20325 [Gemmataceae bacterium]
MSEQRAFGDVALAQNPEPRCASVLLIDVSGSMGEIVANAGRDTGQTVQADGRTYRIATSGTTKIDLVNEGLRAYHADMMADSLARQRVEASIITFGSGVQTVLPFVGAEEFFPPILVAAGETAMGAGILRAIEAIDARKRLYRENGLNYFRPWIFLITDGRPVETPPDLWRTAAERVHAGEKKKEFAFFAVGVQGAGEATDFDVLKQISVRQPLPLKGYSFREMFIWLSQSQRTLSHSSPNQEDQVKFDSPAGWANL